MREEVRQKWKEGVGGGDSNSQNGREFEETYERVGVKVHIVVNLMLGTISTVLGTSRH